MNNAKGMCTGISVWLIIKVVINWLIGGGLNFRDLVVAVLLAAGLITGKDLIRQLKDRKLHERLIIPSVMLRSEGDMFLDDMTIKTLSQRLNIKVTPVANDGWDFLEKITGKG